MTSKRKKSGYIEKFLKQADKAIEEGVKRADEVLEDAVEFGIVTKGIAEKQSKKLRKQAEKEAEKLRKEGLKRFSEGIDSAKSIATSANGDLETLEKLGNLRKSGVITEKEFQAKKKKILARI